MVMISIQQILVPTDFSEPSEVAVKYGKAFAETFRARLHLLHVVDDCLTSWPSEGASVVVPVAIEELEAQAKAQLRAILPDAERERIRTCVLTLRGSPSMEIASYALSEKIDLIIMGTHGRSPMAHLLMGSVAEKVVRKAPCPVLIVRHPEHEFVVP
jgi:universal stress protein A